MSTMLDRDHDLTPEHSRQDLVLSAPALLGIFFALSMVCAVCFGFGYSSAHGLHLPSRGNAADMPTAAATQTPAAPAQHSATPADASDSTLDPSNDANNDEADGGKATASPAARGTAASKPAPGVAAGGSQYWPSAEAQPGQEVAAEARPSVVPRAVMQPQTPTVIAPRQTATLAPSNQLAAAAERPASVPTPAPMATTAPTGTAGAAALPGAGMMVQIAAVGHAADAQTLSNALRHDGFAPIVRTTTGDPFFHVQVGPFASLAAAKAMRTRLADSGYNAFIKP